jgi:hypothetical protein
MKNARLGVEARPAGCHAGGAWGPFPDRPFSCESLRSRPFGAAPCGSRIRFLLTLALRSRAKDLPVFASLGPSPMKVCGPASRSWRTSSGVASHQTASSEEEPCSLLECAARRFASLSRAWPARRPSRSKFCGPSWDDPCRVPLRFSTRRLRSRVALQKDISSGASPGWPWLDPREDLPFACRRRSVLWSPAARREASELTSAQDRDSVRHFGWKTIVSRLLV